MHVPTIGLEIHVELKTKTKMFCSCPNDPEERHPNINVCPICMGHPGTLPTINKEAVLEVVKAGLALGGKIATGTNFDRKSYFYPDLPKGFQISQYEKPIVSGGTLNGIRIRRIHLEEDAGRLLHSDDGKSSLVDFNRAGLPLMELVTEPDIKNAEEAVKFARELQLILRYLGVSDADMERGQMRVEANISLDMSTKVEVKNINSFRAVHDAIKYELERQEEVIKEGKEVHQETRGWNEGKSRTESQRSKESAHDYRYFPEPDLPPLDLKGLDLKEIKNNLPELPEAKRHRFVKEYGFDLIHIETIIEDKVTADYFENSASELKQLLPKTNYQNLLNYFTSDLRGLMKEQGIRMVGLKISAEHLAHLAAKIEKGELSSRLAKDLLKKMFETGEDPENLMQKEGISLMSNESQLEEFISEAINSNPKAIEDYKNGKAQSLQFLVGQVMSKTKGKADPQVLRSMLLEKLK
ncbi:MAG: Asp-tRNA(Asn)/Glu-tRNA(Gln) amidotransferase subunit GatB [Patescibacteria group bacterium]